MVWFLGGMTALSLFAVIAENHKGKAVCLTVCFVASLAALMAAKVM